MRQRLIREIASSVVTAGGERSILEGLFRSMVRGTDATGGILYSRKASGELQPTFSTGVPLDLLDPGKILHPQVLEQVLQGEPVFVWEAESDPRVIWEGKVRLPSSLLFLPLKAHRGTRGLLLLAFQGRKNFSPEDLDFLDALAELGGNILERAAQEAQLAREAMEARRDLDRVKKERGQFLNFLSMVAHDLKSPLAAEQFFLKLLLRKASDRLEPRWVEGIKRSIRRLDMMMDMISSLLDLSRLESGQALEEFKPVWWEEILGAVLETAHELAAPKGIQVSAEIKRPLPEVFASDVRLQQLILNLVSNSVRHTPRKGRITITAQRLGDQVMVSVEDGGTGIPPEILPRIFDEFFKGDPDSPEGTGLGLSICKRIVAIHGGRIWAESPVPETGKGTRVTFVLPVGLSCPLRKEEGEPSTEPGLSVPVGQPWEDMLAMTGKRETTQQGDAGAFPQS
jgi:signal transduction histidine kinase